MLFGTELTDADFADLEARAIDRATATAAGLRHVDHLSGKELVRARARGDYEGIAIPIRIPGNGDYAVSYILRRRNPEVDASTGRLLRKYITSREDRNHIYYPPGVTVDMLKDPRIPLLWTEGAFKVLALWRPARIRLIDGNPPFIPLGLSGIYNYRGTVGITTNEHGVRVPVKDVLTDFGLIVFDGRKNIVAYDADLTRKPPVRIARWQFSQVLRERGAEVGYLEWPEAQGKGIDDWLARAGADVVLQAIAKVQFNALTGWKAALQCTDTGKPKPILLNAIHALRQAPEWQGVLEFNQFTLRVEIANQPPWGVHVAKIDRVWSDDDDCRTCAWLQAQHIEVPVGIASDAVRTVAKEHVVHPVREYLESLQWDGECRVDTWLTRYLGVKPSNYSSAVGRRWLMSGAARMFQPGCKADCCIILEGPQGLGKSTAVRILGQPWFSDEISELGTKDAIMQAHSAWIIELSELASMSKAEVSRIKSFLSRSTDQFRPPWGRHVISAPRQSIFVGTVNQSTYLRDETGGRRFWPVNCGAIDLKALEQDRDQLWAEAVQLYRDGSPWWIDSDRLTKDAKHQQQSRYEGDAWDEPIHDFIANKRDVSVVEILRECIHKDTGLWSPFDETRVARSLKSQGWERYKTPRVVGGKRRWRYRRVK